jgi:hypothetical protein
MGLETRRLHYEFRVSLMTGALTDYNPFCAKMKETSRRGSDQSRVRVHGTGQVFHQIWFQKDASPQNLYPEQPQSFHKERLDLL